MGPFLKEGYFPKSISGKNSAVSFLVPVPLWFYDGDIDRRRQVTVMRTGRLSAAVSRLFCRRASCAFTFRVPMRVTAVYRYSTGGNACYPLCPRCQTTLPREYQQYCDRCGQCLSWERFDEAELIAHPLHEAP